MSVQNSPGRLRPSGTPVPTAFEESNRPWPSQPIAASPRHRAAREPQIAEVDLAGWTAHLGRPHKESRRSRTLAHLGGLASLVALLAYLAWRISDTLPHGNLNLAGAWLLIAFEALPIAGIVIKIVTLWNIDGRSPEPITELPTGLRVAVLIPTCNEPIEVIAPTIAAACALAPAHETWVLDDGDRPWVRDMSAAYGARYVCRPVHDHAKAGNMNHALDLMAAEADDDSGGIDIIAVLDCDHVPLPTFLTATLGWFDDPELALVQGPQTYYNSGAFDDDGLTGEQGMFFNVLLPARNHDGAGPFWCGSTSLLRVAALGEVGGVSTDTIVEDMHTTLNFIRGGWKTAYHHQTLALGLAPATAEQYLLQRRRWGMGSMQVLTHERLWAAKRWLGWRNFYEYLTGTLWWLEGIATLLVFAIPCVVLISGARTSTAGPVAFGVVFVAMFSVRMWGAKQLLRGQIHWPTAFALRIFRVPIGIACLWWLISRRTLEFEVTPKGASDERLRGRTPRVLWALVAVTSAMVAYAVVGVLGWAPWRTSNGATAASGLWLVVAILALVMGTTRIRANEFATSRRNAYRVSVAATVVVNGHRGELEDVSIGGAAVRMPAGSLPSSGIVTVQLPGSTDIPLEVVRVIRTATADRASLRVVSHDWASYRVVSLWLFHTPTGVINGLPAEIPAVALRSTS